MIGSPEELLHGAAVDYPGILAMKSNGVDIKNVEKRFNIVTKDVSPAERYWAERKADTLAESMSAVGLISNMQGKTQGL